jgi:hypothetical protein
MFITHDASSILETMNCLSWVTLQAFERSKSLYLFLKYVVFVISSRHVVFLLRVLAPPQRFGVTILIVIFGDDMRSPLIPNSLDGIQGRKYVSLGPHPRSENIQKVSAVCMNSTTYDDVYFVAGIYDTPREEVARVTYQLPTFNSPPGPIPRPPAEEQYLNLLYNPGLSKSYGESLSFEVYLDRELANPHSRTKKLERFKIYQANTQLLLKKIMAEELRNLDGRNVRQAKADAAFKWREQVKADGQKKKKARWMHSARNAELERKASKRTKKDERKRRLLTEMVLKEEPNQFIPKSQN